MRDPALHITRTSLVKVLKEVGITVTITQATEIIRKAKRYQIKDRYVLQANSRQKAKADRVIATEADGGDIDIFQRLLLAQRQILGHKSLLVIRKNDATYIALKELTQSAELFVKTFNIYPIELGYKKFIDMGFMLMGKKYDIYRFKRSIERIFQTYENMDIVKNDENKEGTLYFYEYWRTAMIAYANVDKELNIAEMVNMIYGRQEAEENGAEYDDWITAQFEGLMWLNAIPELSQFYGEQSVQRYNKYITKLQKKAEPDNLPETFASDAEAEYYKKLNQSLK